MSDASAGSSDSDSPPEGIGSGLPTGYRIGEWRLTERIGAGSWAVVYAAESTADGARAAVKLLRTERLSPGQRETVDELARREVRFGLAAEHPHVVRTRASLTVGDAERPSLDGTTALVMDRADRSLQELLDGGAEAPAWAERVRVLRGVASGLAHLHGRGWVHGDLKPANVLLTDDGHVWLADFGLTAELDGTHAYVLPLGSLDHVPPEWWSERRGGRSVVRPSADVWAFGVLAHQVLTGGLHPFPGGSARARALAAQSYAGGRAPLRLDTRLSQGWARLIADCLRPGHVERAALSAEEVAARVGELAAEGREGEGPVGAGRVRDPRRRPRTAVLVGVACAVLLAAGTGAGALVASGDSGAGPGNSGARGGGSAAPGSRSPGAGGVRGDGILAARGGELAAGTDVPRSLEGDIERSARRCGDEAVSPALVAGILKEESGFRSGAEHPRDHEYGIAMWTPRVFAHWKVDGDGDGRADYRSPADAIATMSPFLCWLGEQFRAQGLRGDLPALIAAGYLTSDEAVIREGGVPAAQRARVERIMRYTARYTR
ncbi:serine/threonine-protein kinase [Streptomyces sp. ODS28]|uniref:serine/threonine-protein kinase n=1 Tax=Streptomyces sp. ODS28 TaxID=3136688 RepID=UPI0031EE3E6F